MTRRLTPMIDDPETEPAVRDLLQAGREHAVADYDFEAGLKRHMAVIAAGTPMPDWAKGLETSGTGAGTGTATTAATGAGASAALGGVVWLVVPVVTAAVVAAAMWARNAEPVAPTGATAPAVGVHPVQPSGSSANVPEAAPAREQKALLEPELAEAEAVLPSEPAVQVVRARANRASTGSKVRVADAKATRSGTPRISGASRSSSGELFSTARPAVATSAEPTELAPSEQPVREAPAREQASSEPTPKPPARLDDARLEREMGMLAVAQRVIHTDPGRTLSLVRQSAREFGDTMFAPERGQLELLALVKLGKLDEAKRLARPYLARYPNGPFSDRVRRALASGRVDR